MRGIAERCGCDDTGGDGSGGDEAPVARGRDTQQTCSQTVWSPYRTVILLGYGEWHRTVRAALMVQRDGGTGDDASGELPSCGNAQSASAVWSGMVSGLQSEYARARNTAGTRSTYDAWQLHEKPHKEGGE